MEPTHVKKAGQDFWDANPCGGNWNNYADFLAWIQRIEPYGFEITKRHDWGGKRVLDVGCGQGTLINYLPSFGAIMFGADMSLASLRRAAAGANELGYSDVVHVAAADAEILPFRRECFDAVLCFGVLHHTPDTQSGIEELWRVLKPGGLAIVMLYRSGNPKWWMVRLVRCLSTLTDHITGKDHTITHWLRKRQRFDNVSGTALLELFGVPVLKGFSNKQVREIFHMFSTVEITNHQPGFRRLADVVKILKPLENFLGWFDQRVMQIWGFYQVIHAIK